MGGNVTNIKDLAERIGLSVTTVSRVLNGKSEAYRISKDTQAKVLEAAREFIIPQIGLHADSDSTKPKPSG
jgi:transcriptional regulator with XRE-family HTH domain